MSLVLDWLSNVCFFSQGTFFWICDFIECQLDLLYLGWVLTLLKPALLTIFILPLSILLMLYFSSLLLYIYTYRRTRMREVLHESLNDPWVGGRYLISLLWDAHGYIWHGYDVQGLEHMPSNRGGLIVYYHGAIPLDVYYLVARLITSTGQHMHCVGDRFLQKIPGWQSILEAFHIAPCSVSDCVKTVSEGHLLAVSPGGVREAQFSDHSYALLWGSRMGFAKVAIQANCPIIPMFTKNLREAFRVVSFPSMLWNGLYSRFKLPFAPIYGGFPVKLVSYLGPCIYPLPGETAEHLAGRVERSVYRLIAQHQRLPGNILAALLDRLHPCIAPTLLGPGAGKLPPHVMLGAEDESGQQQDLGDGRKEVVSEEKVVVGERETDSITKPTPQGNDELELLKINDVEHESKEACKQSPNDENKTENLSGLVLIKKREQTRHPQQQQEGRGEVEERMRACIEQVLPAANGDDRLKSPCQEEAGPKRIELIQPLRRRSDTFDEENRTAVHLEHEQVEYSTPFVVDDTCERVRENISSSHCKIVDACYLETSKRKELLDAEDLAEGLTSEVSTSCHDEVRDDCAQHFKSLPTHTSTAALTKISTMLCSLELEDSHKFSKDIKAHGKVSMSSREEPCLTLASGNLTDTDANSESFGEACKSIFDDATQPFETDLSKYSLVTRETLSKRLPAACLGADDSITNKSCHQRKSEEANSTTNLIVVQSLSLPPPRSDLQGCVEKTAFVSDPGTPEGKTTFTEHPMMLQEPIASIGHHETPEDRISSVGGPEILDSSEAKGLSTDRCSSGVAVFTLSADSSSASLRSRVESELIDAMQPLKEPSVTPDLPTSIVAAMKGFVKLGEASFSGGVLEESSSGVGEFETVAAGDDSEPSTAGDDGSSSSGGRRDGSSDSSDGRSSGSSFELLSTTKSSSLD